MIGPNPYQDKPWNKSYPPGASWEAPIPVYPVFDLLEKTVQIHPDRPAIDFLGFQQSWADIYALSLKFAEGLQGLGITKGSKVGLFLPNTPYYMIAYYAVARTGATIVNFNPLYADNELSKQIEDSETDLMVTLDLAMMYDKMERMLHGTRLKKIIVCPFLKILPFPKNILFKIFRASEMAAITPGLRVLMYEDLVNNAGRPTHVRIDAENDIALLQYTGGTTGIPKGAMLTHANVVANVEQIIRWFSDARPGQDKMLGVIPFFHVFAMTAVMNMSVRMGFEIIATPRFDLEETLKILHKKKPHIFPAVPAIYTAINGHRHLEKFDLKSLRYCVSGGAPLPVEVKKTFEKNTGCVLVEGYGLTESSPVVCVNPLVGENKAGSIGLPFPGTMVELIDPTDKVTPVKQGERGELCVRGPQVMKGYWNKPGETADVLRDGRLYTGDIAIMDEEGYFFIVDRIKDMIITNGYNVYPRNVEEAIYLHPAVEECIVAGIPDKNRGEAVKAWIKMKEGRTASVEDFREFLKDKISPMEIPRHFEMRDKPLPKTMIGKLSRKDLLAEEREKT